LGAGGHGKDVLAIAQGIWDYRFLTFLDDDPKHGYPRCSDLKGFTGATEYVVGVNHGGVREHMAQEYGRDRTAATLIHPTAFVGPDCVIGQGCVLGPYSVLTTNVTLGDHVHLNVGASISQGSTLHDYVTLGPGARVCGDALIGARTTIGVGASVANLISVGSDVYVGAHSCALRDIPAGWTVGHTPARRIK
jgi:hypothetical protein